MSTAKTRKKMEKRTDDTPESATDIEKERLDDEAVSEAVNVDNGTKSVLPGPPIPPAIQEEIKDEGEVGAQPGRNARTKKNKHKGASEMVDPSQIREHMEVVGSDGEHVGTVDRCEGDNLKLTKNDPAAGGEHHYIPLAWVNSVDQRVHLAHPGNEARANWG